jgi:hypothetical protein
MTSLELFRYLNNFSAALAIASVFVNSIKLIKKLAFIDNSYEVYFIKPLTILLIPITI